MRVVRDCNRLPREVVEAPIPQSVQDQVGWGSEKPDVVDGILPMAEGTGLDHI